MRSLFSIALPALLVASTPAIPTIPTIRAPGPPTNGIVAATDGTVYFVDSFHRTVWRVQPGRGLTAFVTNRNGRSLQIDEAGSIYGTHQPTQGTVVTWRADPDGTVMELSRTNVPEGTGHSFLFDGAGTDMIGWTGDGRRSGVLLWQTGLHHQKVLAGGALGDQDGAGSSARFLPIGGMVRTSTGELLVTSGPTVRRVAADGRVSTVVSGEKLLAPRNSFLARLLGDVQAHLTGIAVDAEGSIYVANAARESVVRIRAGGKVEEVMKSDAGWTPTGVTTAGGCVYILEYGDGVRVRRLSADGTVSTLALLRPTKNIAAAISSLPTTQI